MNRNLFRRVEQCAPIESEELAQRVMDECFDIYLADNTHTWVLGADGTYERLEPGDEEPVNAQIHLLQSIAETQLHV